MFSIIIPLYNKEQFIQNTLERLLHQTFQDFEVIIVNDGSTDNGLKIVEEFDDERIRIYTQENQGVSVARNKGIELANSPYIAFLDADDEWQSDFLEMMNQLITQFPHQKLFSAAIEIDTGNAILPALYTLSNPVKENVFIENYFKGSMKYSLIFTSCAVFHHTVFQEIGGFDERIRSGQDTDLWIRMGAKYEVVFLNKIMCRYVCDNQSLSKDRQYKGIKLRYEKFKDLEQAYPDAKKFLDWHRYSEILSNKILGNQKNICTLKKDIELKNLSLKQKILLEIPNFMLRFLLKIEPFLIKLGLRKTSFKG